MAMLYVGRNQVSKEEICKMFRVDMNMILKRPSFEVAKHRQKIDRVNGGVIKTGKGMGVRSSFMATDPVTSMKVEIRYAESHIPKQVGNVLQDVFEPRYVQFMGVKKAYQNNPELAIFFYLNPINEESPLRNPNNKVKPKLSYIDTKKRAQAKNASIDALTEALAHAKNLDSTELIILAKGLGIKGINGKDEDDVRADVREFAAKFPKIYNEKTLSRLTYFEGKILHLIDMGVIKMNTIGTVRRWSWAGGPKEGEVILDIHNSTQDAKIALKNHIFEDMNSYMSLLDNITDTLSATEKAKRFLDAQEFKAVDEKPVETIGDALPDHLKQVNAPIIADKPALNYETAHIKTFADAVDYLTKRDGKRPSNVVASQFLKDVLGN